MICTTLLFVLRSVCGCVQSVVDMYWTTFGIIMYVIRNSVRVVVTKKLGIFKGIYLRKFYKSIEE